MTLEFVDLRADAADKYSWIPFPSSDDYENQHWWNSARDSIGDPWFVRVLRDGAEVARVQLDERGGANPTYDGVPELGDERLKIHLIEVAASSRDCGVGTAVVRGLEARHRDRRLLAYSQGADRFWTSLGWDRFDYPGPGTSMPLFIQPAR